jgi:tetratricopeptide (TPR) repeat protein
MRAANHDPERRYPSMDALLADLERDGPRRWIAAAAVAALVGVLAVGADRLIAGGPPAPCGDAGERLADAWGPARKTSVRTALLAHRVPYAATAWTAVERTLDDYADRWAAAYGDTCRATTVRHDQSIEVMTLRMGCLSSRRQELDQATLQLMNPAIPIEGVTQVATSLTALGGCDDVAALSAVVAPPTDPKAAARVVELERRLAAAKAQSNAGLYQESIAATRALLPETLATGYSPLIARTYFRLAVTSMNADQLTDAEPILYHALWAAEGGGDDELVAWIWSVLAVLVGYEEGRPDEGERLVEHDAAVVARLGIRSPGLAAIAHARLIETKSTLAFGRRDLQRAVELGQQAIDEQERQRGIQSIDAARWHMNQAANLHVLGRYREALAEYDRAEAIFKAVAGPGHPELVRFDAQVAGTLQALGRLDQAATRLERALGGADAAFGRDSRDTAVILEQVVGLRMAQRRLADALPLAERAVTIRRALNGSPPAEILAAENLRADLLYELGRRDEAERTLRDALIAGERALGAANPALVDPLRLSAAIAYDHGRLDTAVAQLGRAVTIAESAREAPRRIGRLKWALARALWASGSQRRAIELARVVARDMVGVADAGELAAEVQAWLREHRAPASGVP